MIGIYNHTGGCRLIKCTTQMDSTFTCDCTNGLHTGVPSYLSLQRFSLSFDPLLIIWKAKNTLIFKPSVVLNKMIWQPVQVGLVGIRLAKKRIDVISESVHKDRKLLYTSAHTVSLHVIKVWFNWHHMLCLLISYFLHKDKDSSLDFVDFILNMSILWDKLADTRNYQNRYRPILVNYD